MNFCIGLLRCVLPTKGRIDCLSLYWEEPNNAFVAKLSRSIPKLNGTVSAEYRIRRPAIITKTFLLVEVNSLESQTLQKTGNRRGCILLGGSQNAVGHGGLLQLTLRFLAHLRFQVGIAGNQQASLS